MDPKTEKSHLTPESIMLFINHFQKSRILLTAFELDIFSILEQSPKKSDEVAQLIKADLRATDRLMNAVVVLGFLKKNNGIFENTPASATYFVKRKPEYLDGLRHSASLWKTWSLLTESVREGTSVFERSREINERGSEWLDAFIGAMHYRASRQAPGVVAKLDLNGVHRVLDVGGGSGAFSMAFVKTGNGISATVFDLPNVIPLTRKYIHEDGMDDKIDLFTGDYNTDQLPSGYDLTFLSAIIHSNSYNDNVNLIKKCASSLNPEGQLIIQDQVMDEERTSPPGGALFALNMLVGTEAGDTYTENEIRDWFIQAKIRFEKRIETITGNALIIGRKTVSDS